MRTKRFGFFLSVVVILAMAFGWALISVVSEAATINVTANAPDALGNNGSCSLREAITNINNGATTWADCAPTGAYGTSDTINIPAGTYTITIPGAGESLNATGDYDLLTSMSIVGAGADLTRIDGGGIDRVFNIIYGGNFSFSGVTITGGATANNGGGILNTGTLTVNNSIIRNNTASLGGGIYNSSGTLTHTVNHLTVTNSTISNNTATNGINTASGGGIYNDCAAGYGSTISNTTISNNTATWRGGGIYNVGQLPSIESMIVNSTISNNSAFEGSGVYRGGRVCLDSLKRFLSGKLLCLMPLPASAVV